MIDLPFPYAKQSLNEDDFNAVTEALKQKVITRGPLVEAFEKAVANYCGAQFAVAFNSGSTALLGASFAADITIHDKVLTTPNTFVSSVGSPMQLGASPVFMDIDPESGNFDLEQLEWNLAAPLSRGKKVIMPVHFSGIAVDMNKLDEMIADPDTIVIEDAAHALGSRYSDGQKVGCCAFSQMTAFSFHPSKNITTTEGGMILTNDENLWHRLRLYRNNGIERDPQYLQERAALGYYEVEALSSNFNFTEIQAALGLSQLKRLDLFADHRRKLLKRYRENLLGIEGINMFNPQYDPATAYHLCVLQIAFDKYKISRAETMRRLLDKGIGTQVHYIPVYRHPYFQKTFGEISDFFPKMERYYSQALTMPLYYDLQLSDVDHICETLKKVLAIS